MSELGNYLKEKREEKEMSLDDLQRTTKIQKRYLVAIEEGNFDTLPGIFYARAFVKTYAEAIGLNAEEVLHTYRNELPNTQSETVDLPSRAERTKPVKSSNSPSKNGGRPLSAILVPILILLVIGAIVYFVWNLDFGTNNNEPNEEAQEGSTYDGPSPDEEEANDDEASNEEDDAEGNEEDENNDAAEEEATDSELVLEDERATAQTFTLTNADAFESLVIEMNDEGTYVEVRESEDTGTVEQNYPPFGETFNPDVSELDSLYVRIGFGAEVDTFLVNDLEIELLDTSSVQVIEVLLDDESE
ncbi:helix-turn-helix domain-containing protein [Shouchella sp. JSM 1781072]|uniref:helix-turn-helix domain-containing protein n=1 Tax=Bacillaceae TaxID=186817 RepID=UPI000C073BD4|nr:MULTISPECIES: helix-turn-helix domain-containing protein [Bacillaceae]UTR04711.1 helix-turn-helix domain-containing protein [Alkalihalobacillus sp. LMS6]